MAGPPVLVLALAGETFMLGERGGYWEDAFRSEEVAVKRDSTRTVGTAGKPEPATH